MPYGQHKGRPIETLPGSYLVALYSDAGAMEKHPAIKNYIETNYRALLPIKKVYTPLCDTFKVCFVDKEAADKELKAIRQDPRKHKKPVRSYQCERCGFWHHTSKAS
jgi:hypothetical protein